MTKELLDLLRFRRLDSRNGFASGDENTVQLMAAAADEIERLKTANAQMLEHGREMWADVERLRAALENISTVRPLEHFPAVTALAYCREKALKALGAQDEPTAPTISVCSAHPVRDPDCPQCNVPDAWVCLDSLKGHAGDPCPRCGTGPCLAIGRPPMRTGEQR